MINIGEISKPSVSESPLKPRRSQADSEKVIATDSIDPLAHVSNKRESELAEKKKKQKKDTETEKARLAASQKEALKDKDTRKDKQTLKEIESSSYDEKGRQIHHGSLDIKA